MTRSIFIVDDEPFILRLIEASLRKGGYRITPFVGAAAAISAASTHPPDLFILDLVMPELDGLAALRQIKSLQDLAAVPVIMLTSRSHQITEQEVHAAGAALFLTKPFSPSDLLHRVRDLIGEATFGL